MKKLNDLLTMTGHFLQGRSPNQLVIQFTDHCNALCPQCGMRVTEKFPRTRLDNDRLARIIDHAAEIGVQSLSLTGGEPLMFLDQILPLIRRAKDRGIDFARTGTNGFVFMNSDKPDFSDKMKRLAESLGKSGLYSFWISLDSAEPALHEKMRGLPGVIRGIEKAIPIFRDFGVYPSANLGLNRNAGGADLYPQPGIIDDPAVSATGFLQRYRQSLSRFYQFVVDLGFTIASVCYPMSVDEQDRDLQTVYEASSIDAVIRFSRREKYLMYKALFDVIPAFRDKIRIFTPRTTLYCLMKELEDNATVGSACRGGIDYFFVSARDGHVYPCGYRGQDDLGDAETFDPKTLAGKPWCRACDWECFRDPSFLIGSFLEGKEGLKHLVSDPALPALLLADFNYYRKCDFFRGIKA